MHYWLNSLLEYLQNNISLLQDSLVDSKISLIQPEGTYLMWLDCHALNLTDRELKNFFIDEAGLWLHSGSTFGAGAVDL